MRDLKLRQSRSGCILVVKDTEFDAVEWAGLAASRLNIVYSNGAA
jgi:hypothetical protein